MEFMPVQLSLVYLGGDGLSGFAAYVATAGDCPSGPARIPLAGEICLVTIQWLLRSLGDSHVTGLSSWKERFEGADMAIRSTGQVPSSNNGLRHAHRDHPLGDIRVGFPGGRH
jgi:hypothetical protein